MANTMCVHCGKGRASIAYPAGVRGAKQGVHQLWIHSKCKEVRKVISIDLIEIDEELTLRLKSAFSPEALKELTASIYKDGFRSPLGVMKVKGRNTYKLVAGFRRYYSLRDLKMDTVTVIVLKAPPPFNINEYHRIERL